jgi:alpha/beta hydrolase family protein
MSRRELAQMAAAVATARAIPLGAQAPAPFDSAQDRPSGYIGPLTGITDGLDDRRFDPVAYTRDRYGAAPRRLRFQARTRAQAEAWQKTLRAKLTELVGGFPSEHQPLRPVTLETRVFPGYRREKIVFDSRPGVSVLAYLLLPDKTPSPAATMICVPGHGRGVDDIVGIDEQGRERTDKAGYQHDFAIQVVEAGMAAVAIEPMAFGCRRDPLNARQGLSRKGCEPTAGGALLLGETMIAWRVWDVMRAIDYIATRPELNANRVGCMGISGGGTATVFSAALEPRIRAAMVSGYLNTFRDSIGSLAHCIDNYVPGILNWAEMHDIAGLIAPRPLFIESGEKDNIFPIAASIESFKQVREVYGVFDAADRIEQEVFPDEHAFWGKRGIPFMARHLSNA